MMAKYLGDEVRPDQIIDSLQDALPVIPGVRLSPTIEGVLGYGMNKDFWLREDIWRGPDIDPSLEVTRRTNPAFIKAGDITGLSPERTRYVLSQLFTRGNIYTSLAGYSSKILLDEVSPAERRMITEEAILKKPFIRRVLKATNPAIKQREVIDEEKQKATTETYMRSRKLDDLLLLKEEGLATKKDVVKFIREEAIEHPEEVSRMIDRMVRFERMDKLQDKRWWINLSAVSSPEAKARIYWRRYRDEGPAVQKRLNKDRARVPGITSSRFYMELRRLKKTNGSP